MALDKYDVQSPLDHPDHCDVSPENGDSHHDGSHRIEESKNSRDAPTTLNRTKKCDMQHLPKYALPAPCGLFYLPLFIPYTAKGIVNRCRVQTPY